VVAVKDERDQLYLELGVRRHAGRRRNVGRNAGLAQSVLFLGLLVALAYQIAFLPTGSAHSLDSGAQTCRDMLTNEASARYV
jgi:hypothetical protein